LIVLLVGIEKPGSIPDSDIAAGFVKKGRGHDGQCHPAEQQGKARLAIRAFPTARLSTS